MIYSNSEFKIILQFFVVAILYASIRSLINMFSKYTRGV